MPTWNVGEVTEIVNELLPPGEYQAVVKKATLGLVANGKHQGADKLDLFFRVDNRTTLREGLVFVESLSWKLNQFVHATQLGRVGDVIEIDDQNVIGAKCILRLSQRDIIKQDGTKSAVNHVERFIRPSAVVDDVIF